MQSKNFSSPLSQEHFGSKKDPHNKFLGSNNCIAMVAKCPKTYKGKRVKN